MALEEELRQLLRDAEGDIRAVIAEAEGDEGEAGNEDADEDEDEDDEAEAVDGGVGGFVSRYVMYRRVTPLTRTARIFHEGQDVAFGSSGSSGRSEGGADGTESDSTPTMPPLHNYHIHSSSCPSSSSHSSSYSNVAASELATYGAFLAVPTPTGDTTTTTSTSKISDNNNSSNGSGCYNNYPCDSRGVLVDCLAGVGARTRPADPHHPLARSLGYGAIGAVAGY